MAAALTVEDLKVAYGRIEAVPGLSFELQPGALLALLGANGAGKSSTLNAIAGLVKPAGGRVLLGDTNLARSAPHRITRKGVALVPEGRLVLSPLSVEENLALSRYGLGGRDSADLAYVFSLFPRLKERRKQLAGLLSGGEQQMLAVARALMTKPTVLLLDEPSMGLAPALVNVVMEAVRTIHESGVSVILVEQNAAVALPLADRAMVLSRGVCVAEGTTAELESDPGLLARYLGLDDELTAANLVSEDPA
jgi:branched-chain amino acid transport system ATP-binding protein